VSPRTARAASPSPPDGRSGIGLDARAGFATATGGRERNEDFAAFAGGADYPGKGVVAAIADGVGGAKGGRVAAELAVRSFIEGYRGQSELLSVRQTSGRSLDAINRWVHTLGRSDVSLEGMACTFTALILRGRQAHVVHVGDSRLYRLRDGTLSRLTTDHASPLRGLSHMLTRAVGAADSLRVDYDAEPARVHDRYLLCSDGVHGGLSDKWLHDELSRRSAPEETAHSLVEAALAARIGDNATALVVDVIDLPHADQLDLELAIAAKPIAPPPRIGSTVDGFELGKLLSDGRYSRVFEAIDTVRQRTVILKFPKPVTGADTVLRQAFLREAWIAARVRSPFVCEVIDLPPDRATCLYSAMPFYEGETLEQRLRREPAMPLADGLRIAVMLSKAVAALHRAGIIHRDIKPDNVILEPSGSLKLLDLGVARLPNIEEFPAENAPGTPSFMAPELLAGAPGEQKSDLFALGVTIYRMFARSYPYGEIEPFSHPRFGRPTSLLSHRPDLPAWLDQVLARAVAVAPEERFDDVIEFMFAIEHGATDAAAAPPRRRGLYDRNPLLFWQGIAALLGFLLLAALALR
jgi:serine/threonine protein phosphatase PrpC